jgi:lipopolysaccharide/colanic/teichoic acid biosynthesis glycosyltransferase
MAEIAFPTGVPLPRHRPLTQATTSMGSATSGVRRSQLARSAYADRFAPSLPSRRAHGRSYASIPLFEFLLSGQLLNRGMNVLLSGVALILLLPVLFIIAVVVKLSSRGPVLYLQERVGLDRRALSRAAQNHRRQRDLGGQPFTIYKFRTMRVDAERESGAVWAQQHDPRVTPVGRILRQYRLDELPQLLNVLRGEMNIVGPRPERPAIFAELRTHIAEYPLRQRAKPGITGLAQINHHYDRSLDDVRTKVSYDLEYIRRQSVREDLRIMLKTIPVILWRRGGW